MLSSMSSNAILAKARTMYGRRLTDKDYEDLLACKTVPEVANYLKNETVYSEILSGLNENDVHRGQLETLLRKKIFYEKVSLARFDMNSEKFLSVFFINRMEIEQIMRCISLLNIGRASEYAYEMPVFFEKHTNLNLKSFSEVTNLSELLMFSAILSMLRLYGLSFHRVTNSLMFQKSKPLFIPITLILCLNLSIRIQEVKRKKNFLLLSMLLLISEIS